MRKVIVGVTLATLFASTAAFAERRIAITGTGEGRAANCSHAGIFHACTSGIADRSALNEAKEAAIAQMAEKCENSHGGNLLLTKDGKPVLKGSMSWTKLPEADEAGAPMAAYSVTVGGTCVIEDKKSPAVADRRERRKAEDSTVEFDGRTFVRGSDGLFHPVGANAARE